MSELENIFINLDELNYLAKRLDSFDHNEMMQFNAAVREYNMKEMKELINLTFNLQRYTLIQDVSSMEKVGRTHMLNLQGGLGEEEMENFDFESIGKELIASGWGKITEHGILFENEEIPFEEVYDGLNWSSIFVTLKLKKSLYYRHLFSNGVRYPFDECGRI